MSTLPPPTIEQLRETASRRGLTIPQKDEADFLQLLQMSDSAAKHVLSLPDYSGPGLSPSNGNGGKRREYRKPARDENPLNAWSHKLVYDDEHDVQQTCRLPLAGRDVALKDVISVADVPLTCGTNLAYIYGSGGEDTNKEQEQKKSESPIDATVVSRILEAGGRIAGTATCENYCYSFHSSTSESGPVHNPWAHGYSAGGSSSGCAALLAVRAARKWHHDRSLPYAYADEAGVDLAVGSDQAGSIRLPAAYSGVYGLKPTRGLVPYTGMASLHPLIDHAGPMTTELSDVALLLGAMAGADTWDFRAGPGFPSPSSEKKDYAGDLSRKIASRKEAGEWTPQTAARGLRIGLIREAWEVPNLNDEVGQKIRDAAERFSHLGAAVVEEVSIPLHASGAAIWQTATLMTGMADVTLFNRTTAYPGYPLPHLSSSQPGIQQQQLTDEWLRDLSVKSPTVPFVLFSGDYLGSAYPPSLAAKAMMHVHQLSAAYDDALTKYDVLVTPANPTVAPPHPKGDEGVLTFVAMTGGIGANLCPFNATGHPAMSIPVGWASAPGTELGKLPVGMQMVGRKLGEEDLLFAAAAWEVGGKGLDS